MTYHQAKTANRIMLILADHVGRARAITRDGMERKLRFYGIDIGDRKTRECYSSLPICSSDKGLYIPSSWAEIDEYEKYLTPKMGPGMVKEKIMRLRITYPQLAPVATQHQLELMGARP